MNWLNYHHLYYFWNVAREGSIAAAAQRLGLSQPTISAQIKMLERSMKSALLERAGRGVKLTQQGMTVFRYADEIFALGREMQDALSGRMVGDDLSLHVGVADVVPKIIAHRLLLPAIERAGKVRLTCREGKSDELLAALAIHEMDVVLLDKPFNAVARVSAFNHLLGECGVSFFAPRAAVSQYRRRFPKSLDGAAFLMPTAPSTLRRALDRWLEEENIRVVVAAEFDDSALLKVFGRAGTGLFAGPTAIEREISQQYGVGVIGRVETIRERFYAVTLERRLHHPAVVAIRDAARDSLFVQQ